MIIYKDLYLKRGDIIKLGRVALRVKDYRIEHADKESDQIDSPCADEKIDILPSRSCPE